MATIDDQLVARDFMEDPYPTYRRLQEEAPVYWSDAWGCWLLTRFAHVDAAIRNPAGFQNRVYATWMEKIPAGNRQELASFVDYWTTSGFSQAGSARPHPDPSSRVEGPDARTRSPRSGDASNRSPTPCSTT